MTGEKKSSPDRLKEFEKVLDDYETKLGFTSLSYNSDVDLIMTMDMATMRGMSAEDCGECSLVLAQYATFLQKEHNRQKVRLSWAERELGLIVAQQSGNYGYSIASGKFIKYELLRDSIINGDGAAKVLTNIIRHASSRVITLEQMSSKIGLISKSLIELQQTKRYHR